MDTLNSVIQIIKPSPHLHRKVVALRDRLADTLKVSPRYPNH